MTRSLRAWTVEQMGLMIALIRSGVCQARVLSLFEDAVRYMENSQDVFEVANSDTDDDDDPTLSAINNHSFNSDDLRCFEALEEAVDPWATLLIDLD